MKIKSIVLVVSAGGQDIKRWLPEPFGEDADRLYGRRPYKWLLGELGREEPCYDLLLPEEITILREDRRLTEITAVDEPGATAGGFCSEQVAAFGNALGDRDSKAACLDGDGRLLLRPAKIERLVPRLQEEQRAGRVRVVRVLVFATERLSPERFEDWLVAEGDPQAQKKLRQYRSRHYGNEPCSVGETLARWLGGRFGCDYIGADERFDGRNGARWINYLKDLFHYEGEPGTADHPLQGRVAKYIDDAMLDASRGLNDAYAVIAATGGSNDVKACIAASAELRFSQRAWEYPETERGGAFSAAMLDERPRFVTPTDSLKARSRCLALIEQGEIRGAWAAVSHLADHAAHRGSPDRRWLDYVRQLELFFRGGAFDAEFLPDVWQGLQEPGLLSLLQRAFQVEAALQGRPGDRRIPEALAGVTAFAEHALYLMLCRAIPNCVPEVGLVSVEDGAVLGRDRKPLSKEDRKQLPKEVGACLERGKLKIFGRKSRAMRNWLRMQKAGQSLDWQTMGIAVERLECFLQSGESDPRTKVEGEQDLRGYRNRLSHAALGGEAIEAVKTLSSRTRKCHFAELGNPTLGPLWNLSDKPLPWGERFLGQSLVADVLGHLDVPDAAMLYRQLLTLTVDTLVAAMSVHDGRP